VPGPQELLLIALVALFVLGPERLPEAARSAARMLARIRKYGVSATQDLKGMADLGEIETEVQELRRELNRTRTELRRAVRETVSSAQPRTPPVVPTEEVTDLVSAPAPEVVPAPAAELADDDGSDGAVDVDGADDAPDASR
jgi:sec-independent protein translocase protein TatB